MMLQLKPYQQSAVQTLARYAQEARKLQSADLAYYSLTKAVYKSAPGSLASVPYVCVRIPTGGGKTLVAAHSVGEVFTHYRRQETGLVVWLVPWESILTQTCNALNNKAHPYRQVLDAAFPKGVQIFTVKDALFGTLKPDDLVNSLCIIVSTIDAFRVEVKEGRKVYEPNGSVMAHFTAVAPHVEPALARDEQHQVIPSLENVIRQHTPMVILDEGHNAQTTLSFDTLARLNPAFILEYSATPRGFSNVVVNVPATDLKQAGMVKLPLWLYNHTSWMATLDDARKKRDELEGEAQVERKQTKEYIRPILLIQAEPASATDPNRVTVDRVVAFLTSCQIPPAQIAVKTGAQDDLAGVDLFSSQCPVRYIVTIYALKEGWDCSFAYVLASVANMGQRLAVEQIIGRVLRLPNTVRKHAEALNYAYVYSSSPQFDEAARAVREGLIGNGYAPGDVRQPVEEKPSLTCPRAIVDAQAAVPVLAHRASNGAWTPLLYEHLLAGFSLPACNPALDFTPPDEDRAASFDVAGDTVVVSTQRQLSLPLALREPPMTSPQLVTWLDRRYHNARVSQKDLRQFCQAVIAHLIAQKGASYLPELVHHRFHLLTVVRQAVEGYVEKHAETMLYQYQAQGRLGAVGEVAPWLLPDTLTVIDPYPDALPGHLFSQAVMMNKEEAGLAGKLALSDNLLWWYRNREVEDYYLQGWWGHFYPDFIAKTQSGLILLLEYKGAYLVSGLDAQRKDALGHIWEQASEGTGRFWMVDANNLDAVVAEVKGL